LKKSDKRQQLIEVATDLFNRFGYHAAGIDRVIEESGIAKTTLYRHFKSKEELIVAVINQVDENFRNNIRAFVDNKKASPVDKILATFDYLEQWFSDDAFFGCPFISAAGEYSERNGMVFQASAMHKRLMIAYFEELAHAAQLKNPRQFAEKINLLHEGATAVAHITGNNEAASQARKIAHQLITAALASD